MESRWQNFDETRWSLILRARDDDEALSREAMAELCQDYWFPIYTYVRRKGHPRERAQDLTQAFFVRFLEQGFVDTASQSRGRFRSFLMTAINHFLTDEWRKAKAGIRGGNQTMLSLDFERADRLYADCVTDALTPERAFDLNWAQTVLARALEHLRREYKASGKAELFEALRPTLSDPGGRLGYERVGEQLTMSAGAVRMAAHRFRKRYADLVKEEVSQTLVDPAEAESEMEYLLDLLR